MRIGPEKDYDQRLFLHDWTADTGWGVMGHSMHTELPQDCIEYVLSSFDFWQTPLPRALEDVVRWGAWQTYWMLDITDPYHWFCNVTDVNFSEDWRKYAFDIYDPNTKTTTEADPELLETFVTAPPGQCEQVYQEILKRGGEVFRRQKEAGRPLKGEEGILGTLPHRVGWMIEEAIDGESCWENCLDLLGEDQERLSKFQSFCNNDSDIAYDYFYKAAWAAYLWMVGPAGREWRNGNHDIFWLCNSSKNRSALMYDYNFIDEKHYKVLPRASQSCAACGLDSWCVDMTQIEGVTRHLCEKCINGNTPLYEGATCGTKACKHVHCPNHLMFGQENALHNQLSKYGQLTSRVNQGQMLGASKSGGQKLLTN